MGLGKAIGGFLFVNKEAVESAPEGADLPEEPSKATELDAADLHSDVPAAAVAPQSVKKAEEFLWKNVNATSPAFTTFRDNMTTLEEVVSLEDERYKAALKLTAKQGYAKAVIISNIDAAISLLNTLMTTFKAGQNEEQRKQIGDRQRRVDSIGTIRGQLNEQLRQLDLEEQKLNGEIEEVRQKSVAEETAFDFGHSTVLKSITATKNHLSSS